MAHSINKVSMRKQVSQILEQLWIPESEKAMSIIDVGSKHTSTKIVSECKQF